MRRRSLLAALLLAVAVHADDAEAIAKATRMKTSRQLREILVDLGLKDEKSAKSLSKDELREVAIEENAVARWEDKYPEKKRKPRPAGGGGGGPNMDFSGMQPPEGMDPKEWARVMGQMRGDFSYEPDPEKRRLLEKLKSSGISFAGADGMDIEQYVPLLPEPPATYPRFICAASCAWQAA